jgi:3-hydroxyacyl-CoA dehydrogenase
VASNPPSAAIEAVERSLTLSADAAFDAEREAFIALRDSDQSAALRHIFFAERAASRIPEARGATPRAVSHVGILGGGTMGAGIAAACLLAGLHVTIVERDAQRAALARSRVLSILDDSAARGLLDREARASAERALRIATDFGPLADAHLIIEAVFEDMDVKKAVFAEIDAVARPDAVLASNTSYLDIDDIAAATSDPSRVIGLHFFSPAHVMKLLELIVTRQAAPDVLATGLAFGKRLRKITVPAGVCDGFIGNRIMARYRREADFMLEDGALPQEVDAAMRDFGFPMGVFQMADLAGLDIGWAMRKRQAATRDPSERYVEIADRICEIGRLGPQIRARLVRLYRGPERQTRPLGDGADRGGIRAQGHHPATLRRDAHHGPHPVGHAGRRRGDPGRRHRRHARGDRRGDDQRLRLPALARRADVHAGQGPVIGGFIDWTDAFDNSSYVPGSEALRHIWPDRAATWRADLLGQGKARLDLPYGPGPRERFDLFLPDGEPRGLVVFVHGGYWQWFDKSAFSHFADGPRRRGWAVALPSYPQAPDVRLSAIARAIGAAIGGRGPDPRPGSPCRSFRGRPPRRAHGLRRSAAPREVAGRIETRAHDQRHS